MSPPKLFHFICTIFISLKICTAAPPPTTPDQALNRNLALGSIPIVNDFGSSTNTTLTATDGRTTCVQKVKYQFDKYRPSFTDCAMALRKIPSSTTAATFSNMGATPLYRLPAGVQHGNCRVRIALIAGASREESSWAEVGIAALQLLDACYDVEKSAGTTVAGRDDRIEINVSKIRD
ncbi:hypothetical protein ACLMJK_008439 [Lecanora helva]